MIVRYKKTLIELLRTLKTIQRDPHTHWHLCLTIQESLILHITRVESRIRRLRAATKAFARERSETRTADTALLLKSKIHQALEKKTDYTCMLALFRAIGDGIAMSYVNKWDVKPLAFKESAGFISGKRGSRLERKCLRSAFAHGHVAILNDLTTVFRHGDVTVPKDGFPFTLEIKSGRSHDARAVRQCKRIERLMNYLLTDEIRGLYSDSDCISRHSMAHPEIIHTAELNRLIHDSKSHGSAASQIEPGLFYFVSRSDDVSDLKRFLDSAHFQEPPIVVFVNADKLDVVGYYPFTLSIDEPEDVYSFFAGELFVFVIVDTAVIHDAFDKRGFRCTIQNSEYMIRAFRKDDKDAHLGISQHLFGRIFYEFSGLEWLLDDSISRAERLHKELAAGTTSASTVREARGGPRAGEA